MNTTIDDEQLRKEYRMLCGDDNVRIEIRVRKHGNAWIPDRHGESIVWAVFRKMRVSDFWIIEKFATRKEDVDGNEFVDYDGEEIKRQVLRFQLLEWNLDVPLEFDEDNRLTEECWNTVMKQP